MIDEEGYSLVNEFGGNCLSIFDSQGNKVHTVGNLNAPRGVLLNSETGSLHVTNSVGNTVFKFNL